jgi:AcrR family transcriptional regulator
MSTGKDEKKDLRISRTQHSLMTAMMTLLEKRSFNRITVNDLCEVAMVSRTTFYQHFEDKYDLLRSCLEQIKTVIGEARQEYEFGDLVWAILDYIEENIKIFKNLLLKDVNYELLVMLSAINIEDIKFIIERRIKEGEDFGVPADILAVFLAGGIAELLFWWIEKDFPVSKQEMVDFLTQIVKR